MKSKWMPICCTLFFVCLGANRPVLAAETFDALYLCGIIREINTDKAVVTIDVQSQSCPGRQTFKLPTSMEGIPLIVNARKCFFIDSSTCTDSSTYTITSMEKE